MTAWTENPQALARPRLAPFLVEVPAVIGSGEVRCLALARAAAVGQVPACAAPEAVPSLVAHPVRGPLTDTGLAALPRPGRVRLRHRDPRLALTRISATVLAGTQLRAGRLERIPLAAHELQPVRRVRRDGVNAGRIHPGEHFQAVPEVQGHLLIGPVRLHDPASWRCPPDPGSPVTTPLAASRRTAAPSGNARPAARQQQRAAGHGRGSGSAKSSTRPRLASNGTGMPSGRPARRHRW